MNSQDASHRSLTLTSYILIHPLTSTAANTSHPTTDTIRQHNFYRQITHNANRPTLKSNSLYNTKILNIQAPYEPFHNKTLQHPKKKKNQKPQSHFCIAVLYCYLQYSHMTQRPIMSLCP